MNYTPPNIPPIPAEVRSAQLANPVTNPFLEQAASQATPEDAEIIRNQYMVNPRTGLTNAMEAKIRQNAHENLPPKLADAILDTFLTTDVGQYLRFDTTTLNHENPDPIKVTVTEDLSPENGYQFAVITIENEHTEQKGNFSFHIQGNDAEHRRSIFNELYRAVEILAENAPALANHLIEHQNSTQETARRGYILSGTYNEDIEQQIQQSTITPTYVNVEHLFYNGNAAPRNNKDYRNVYHAAGTNFEGRNIALNEELISAVSSPKVEENGVISQQATSLAPTWLHEIIHYAELIPNNTYARLTASFTDHPDYTPEKRLSIHETIREILSGKFEIRTVDLTNAITAGTEYAESRPAYAGGYNSDSYQAFHNRINEKRQEYINRIEGIPTTPPVEELDPEQLLYLGYIRLMVIEKLEEGKETYPDISAFDENLAEETAKWLEIKQQILNNAEEVLAYVNNLDRESFGFEVASKVLAEIPELSERFEQLQESNTTPSIQGVIHTENADIPYTIDSERNQEMMTAFLAQQMLSR